VGEQFVGAGLAFPMQVDATGGIALVRREREIEEAMRLVLATAPGERPMRPEFGCGIHDFVFASADGATAGQIAYEVRMALGRWEPRIDLEEVAVSFDTEVDGLLYVDIHYAIRGSNDPRNLVFPFYMIPQHEGSEPTGGQ
jgi:phage baseplate assembly protein W